MNDCEMMLLKLLFRYKIHWAGRQNIRFLSWKVEEDPSEDDRPWEVGLVEVEEGEEDWMVEEEAGDWRVVEQAAYSWSYLWRSDWRKFDPADY